MTGHGICSIWPAHSLTGRAIELEAVSKSYDGRPVISPTDLTINHGDFIVICGPNGGGKTTLLKIMLNLLKPDRGSVNYYNGGTRVKSLDIGYLPQKSSIDPKFPMTVADTVASGLLSAPFGKGRLSKAEKADRMEAAMEACGVLQLKDSPLATLSGGQVQRALLARAIASTPPVLMLDEPMSYLDGEHCDLLISLLAAIKGKATVVTVSHRTEELLQLATRELYVDKTIKLI